MASCAYCNKFILFGGVKADGYTFCSARCRANSYYLSVAQQIPPTTLMEVIQNVDREGCPLCKGPGPIDVHAAHTVWSALVLTSWKTRSKVCCRKCGVKGQLGAAALSFFFGWWGFPWGLIVTPIQIGRNIHDMCASPPHPSDQLKRVIGLNMAQRMVAQQAATKAVPPPPPTQ